MTKTATARAIVNAGFAAAAILLSTSLAYAQLAGPPGIPGLPSLTAPVGSTGIPMGSVELGTSGLSPAPVPGLAPMTPGIGAGIGTPIGGGTGLAPLPQPGFPALAPPATGMASPVPGLTGSMGLAGSSGMP